jgi:hypothetical protein
MRPNASSGRAALVAARCDRFVGGYTELIAARV